MALLYKLEIITTGQRDRLFPPQLLEGEWNFLFNSMINVQNITTVHHNVIDNNLISITTCVLFADETELRAFTDAITLTPEQQLIVDEWKIAYNIVSYNHSVYDLQAHAMTGIEWIS